MNAPGWVKRLRFPHPLVLLTGFIVAAAAMTHVLPAGEYDRREDPATGRTLVVPGTYEAVESRPVGWFETFVAIPRGMADAADVVFLVFLIGGAFAVVEATGALRRGITWLVGVLEGRARWAVPVLCLAFAAAGATENMQEEIIALVPPLMLFTSRLGYVPLVAVAASAGSAFVGSAFSPINPFQVQIAQRVSEVPVGSGGFYRLIFLLVAVGLWTWWTARLAARTRGAPQEPEHAAGDGENDRLGRADGVIFLLVATTFGVLVWGLLTLGWGFDELSALFFIMGILVGLIGRLGVTGTARAYVDGFRKMAFAALLIGFARTIYVVMSDGLIIDTVVRGLFVPLESLPVALSAVGMQGAQTVLHVLVPSVSGQAVLTMPVLIPLADLLAMPRQVTILAYHYGAGLCDLITPTNGALMAILAASGVRFEGWIRFAFPRYLALMGLGAASIVIALAIGYS